MFNMYQEVLDALMQMRAAVERGAPEHPSVQRLANVQARFITAVEEAGEAMTVLHDDVQDLLTIDNSNFGDNDGNCKEFRA